MTFYSAGDVACPVCRADLSMAKSESNDQGRGPQPEDLTVCASCLNYLKYVADGGVLSLAQLGTAEFEALPEQQQAALMQVRGVVSQRACGDFLGLQDLN